MSNLSDQLRVEVVGEEIIVILPATSYGITYYKPVPSENLIRGFAVEKRIGS